MYAMSKVAKLMAASSLLMGLSACGGGGSGSTGGTTGISLPTAPVTISSTNQSAVAGAAVDSASGGTSVPVAAQTSATGPSADAVAQKVGQIGRTVVQQIGSTPALVTGAVTTYPCAISGTWSISTSATTGTATFNSCSNITGESTNGTISVSNAVSSASSTSFDSTYSLTITIPGDVLTVTGDMHVAVLGCTTTCTSETLTGSSLKFTSTINGTVALQNYKMGYFNGALTTLTFTFSSTQINGTATFNMVTRFTGNVGSLFPSAGVATVTGANSTILKITALGDETAPANSQAQLELSTDGGATYGAPTVVTWASISSRL